MIALRNEVDPSDPTDHSAKAPMALTIVTLSALHVLCCGLLPLLLSGGLIATILPISPMIGGILALLGLAGFVWHRKKGGATCAANSVGCRTGKIEARQKHSEDVFIVVGRKPLAQGN